MKKRNAIISFMVVVMLCATLAACASSPKSESTGQYIDSSVITTKVKAKLVEEQSLAGLEIGVETYKGVVQLSGFVTSRAQAEKAAEIAASVPGVVSVQNNLLVK